jgi:hydrogenase nickel incorporation protein HypA/HybF
VHELSLSRAIADVVSEHAGGRGVTRVRVQVGHLRQVVPSSLEFCWRMVTDGTELDGCPLDIDHVPAVALCPRCQARTSLDSPVLLCGACGSRDVGLISGEEFLVASIDVVEVS